MMAGPSIALNLVIQRQLTRLSEFIRDMFSDELLGLSLVLLFLFYIYYFTLFHLTLLIYLLTFKILELPLLLGSDAWIFVLCYRCVCRIPAKFL